MSLVDYDYSFQQNPITLVGGVAGTGLLPISSIMQAQNYPNGITGKADPTKPTFASFRPVSGHSLLVNEIATYPFANQATAANAVIAQGLNVSLEMLVPANNFVTASSKLSIMTALKATLDQHTALGGWYNVATPSYVYSGCLLTSLVDASDSGDGEQVQVRWIWNFFQPLITASQLQAAQNASMAKVSSQTQNGGAPLDSSSFTSTASNPSANVVPNYVPAATGSLGANTPSTTSSTAASPLSSISKSFGF